MGNLFVSPRIVLLLARTPTMTSRLLKYLSVEKPDAYLKLVDSLGIRVK
jgi:ribosomal protein S15P/S13E